MVACPSQALQLLGLFARLPKEPLCVTYASLTPSAVPVSSTGWCNRIEPQNNGSASSKHLLSRKHDVMQLLADLLALCVAKTWRLQP